MFDTSFVYLCPRCHYASIEMSELDGGSAKCLKCSWTGINKELIAAPFHHQQGSNQEEVLRQFANDLKFAFREGMMLPLGKLLEKWGFLPEGTPDQRRDALLLFAKNSANAMLRSIIETRQEQAQTEEN